MVAAEKTRSRLNFYLEHHTLHTGKNASTATVFIKDKCSPSQLYLSALTLRLLRFPASKLSSWYRKLVLVWSDRTAFPMETWHRDSRQDTEGVFSSLGVGEQSQQAAFFRTVTRRRTGQRWHPSAVVEGSRASSIWGFVAASHSEVLVNLSTWVLPFNLSPVKPLLLLLQVLPLVPESTLSMSCLRGFF